MASVFLSYSREDRTSVERIARVLQAAGHQVWWDRHIASGSEFAAEIEAQLAKADLVLVVWSASAAKSPWVRDEAGIGRDKGRLLPVVVDGSLPPIGFRQFQALDLAGWKGRNDRRKKALIEAVDMVLGGKALAPAPGTAKQTGLWGKRLWVIAAALVLMIAAGTLAFILSRNGLSGPSPKPTIAVVPFTRASPDPRLSELAAKARESIAFAMSENGMPVRVLGERPKDPGQAGDFLISGELSSEGDKVVASVRLDETAQGVTVFSRRFEAAGDDISNLPERIGAQLAGTLTWAGALLMLDRRNPVDPAITAELLKQAGPSDPRQDYQMAQSTVVKAPNSGIAQLSLAFATAFILDLIPRAERAEALARARRASERAQELAPDFGDVYGPWCFLHSETRLAECEDRLREGKRIDPNAPFLNFFLSQVMRRVGRFDEAFELSQLAHAGDPYVARKIGMLLRMLEVEGEGGEAARLHRQGALWWPEMRPLFFFERRFGILIRGDFEALGRLEKEFAADLPEEYRPIRDLVAAMRSRSLPALRRACADIEGRGPECLIAYAALGDLDSAFALADKLYPRRVGRTPAETERIWLDDPLGIAPFDFITSPAAAPLRRDPRYLALAQRLGLLDYWRSGRPPDFCRKQPEPICAQLLKRG